MRSADKMRSLCSKNMLRPRGSCQGPPLPPACTPSPGRKLRVEAPLHIQEGLGWGPRVAGSRWPGVGRPSRDAASTQHEERGLLSLCPWRVFCLSLQRPLLLSGLLSAAPPQIAMATGPARRAQTAGSPSRGLDMMRQGPGVRHTPTSDEELTTQI